MKAVLNVTGRGGTSLGRRRIHSERLLVLCIPSLVSFLQSGDTLALLKGLGETNWAFYRELTDRDSKAAAQAATPANAAK